MSLFRIIPSILIGKNGAVKGHKFNNHKYIGDPVNILRIFNDKGADEVIFCDIEASINSSDPNYKLLQAISTQAFMPLSYAGGINNLNQIKNILKIGFEKIILNSVLFENVELIRGAADIVGSSSVSVSIDVKRNLLNQYKIYSRSGSKSEHVELSRFLNQVQKLGAGEIIINSIDRDGTEIGADFKLIELALKEVNIPLVYAGGICSTSDIVKCRNLGLSGVSVGSYFTFYGKHRAVLISYVENEKI